MNDFTTLENKIEALPLTKVQDVLQPLYSNGIISFDSYKQILEDKMRKEILAQHPFKISQHKDGRWRTYVITPDGNRRQLVRTTRRNLENDIIANYKKNHCVEDDEDSPSFRDCYFHWRETHDLTVSENTISKYETDFIRYFDREDFSDRPIRSITGDDIERFIFKKVKELSLCRDAVKSLLGYIKGTFRSAYKRRLLSEDVTKDIHASLFFRQCTQRERTTDKLLVPDEDWIPLCNKLLDDIKKHPTYMPNYAILFCSYCGARVGELSVLQWDDIRIDPVSGASFLVIHQSESYIASKKMYVIKDHPKNFKPRIFPITDELREILDRIKSVQKEYGIRTNWVFADENGEHIHKRNICDCLKNRCKQIGITARGMHALRRQFNSDMRCDGVSSTITSSLIGNTKEVNDKHYTFDVYGIDEKAKLVEKTNRKRKSLVS